MKSIVKKMQFKVLLGGFLVTQTVFLFPAEELRPRVQARSSRNQELISSNTDIKKFFLTIQLEKNAQKATDTLVQLLRAGKVQLDQRYVVAMGKDQVVTTPLMMAVRCSRSDIVDLFISRGANPNLGLPSGSTPLLIAFGKNDVSLVSKLIDAGVSIETSWQGDTLLEMAVKSGGQDIKMINMLLDKGARTDRLVGKTIPLLMLAYCRKASPEVIHSLLHHGASINAQSDNGDTILHMAIGKGDQEMVKFLLAAGASIDTGNAQGKTPLSLSQDTNNDIKAIVKHAHCAQEEKRQAEHQSRIDTVKSAADAERVLRIQEQNLFLQEKEKEENQARAENVRLAKRLADEEQARRITQQDVIVKDIARAERKARKRAIGTAQQLSKQERLERIAYYDRMKLKEQEQQTHVLKLKQQQEEKESCQDFNCMVQGAELPSEEDILKEVAKLSELPLQPLPSSLDEKLQEAVKKGFYSEAMRYLHNGANPYVGNPSAFDRAKSQERDDIVRSMSIIFNEPESYKVALDQAALQGNMDYIKNLFDKYHKNARVNTVDYPLVNSRFNIINAINAQGETPMLTAVKNGHIGFANQLLQAFPIAVAGLYHENNDQKTAVDFLLDPDKRIVIKKETHYSPDLLMSLCKKKEDENSYEVCKLLTSLFPATLQPFVIPQGEYTMKQVLDKRQQPFREMVLTLSRFM